MFRTSDDQTGVSGRDSVLLNRAIKEGSVDAVQQLLDRGVNPDSPYKGCTPLSASLKLNHLDIARRLIESGADINRKDKKGRTVLFSTIEVGNKESFVMLINSGCSVNVQDETGLTPLHLAVEAEEFETYMTTLLEKGAYVDTLCINKKTPLHRAIDLLSPERVKLLLKYGPNVQMKEYKDLVEITMDKFCYPVKMIMDELIDYGFTVSKKKIMDPIFMHIAVLRNLVKLVEHLLQNGADPNTKCQLISVFELACNIGHIEMVKLFLKYGVNLLMNGSAIDEAVKHNHLHVIEELLNNGIEKETSKWLFLAVENDSYNVLEFLLDLEMPRFNMNSTFGGKTLAYLAAENDRAEAIEVLWKLGADLDYFGKMSNSPLHAACWLHFENSIETILRLGGNINSLNGNGKTPVFALSKNRLAIVEHVKKHILALSSAGNFVESSNLSFALENCDEKLIAELDAEIETMKTTIIPNSLISFYKLLKSTEAELGFLVNNQSIIDILESHEYKSKFKHYYNFLHTKILVGLKRKEFIDEFNENIVLKSDFLMHLPSTCVHQILSFLSTEDLGIMTGQYLQREELDGPAYQYDELSSPSFESSEEEVYNSDDSEF